jgi:predicted Rossmann fold flavoprotein
MYDVLVIGGGAAGFYGAIHIAESAPDLRVAILERGKSVLTKVRVSGGGRCNVAHAEFDPGSMVENFPRGKKELLGPFHRYCSGDTMEFFNRRGVSLKIEEDGRIFPESNSSQSIIECLMDGVTRLGVRLECNSPVTDMKYTDGIWEVFTNSTSYRCRKVLMATGSNPKIWKILSALGHTIISPVPSLFTFNINDSRLKGLQGIGLRARVSLLEKKKPSTRIDLSIKAEPAKVVRMETEGRILVTHWGLSGPAVLRLSAWGARILSDYDYQFRVQLNWIPDYHTGAVVDVLHDIKEIEARKTVLRTQAFDLPRRLWIRLVLAAGIPKTMRWAETTKKHLEALHAQLTASEFKVEGKSTFKDEFVTAGGISLREVDFRTFQSKILPGLYFAGEVLNVDAITGGFNFQNAWTGAFLAARAITNG